MPRHSRRLIRPGGRSLAPAHNAATERAEELLQGAEAILEDLEDAEDEVRDELLGEGGPGPVLQAQAERLRALRAAELALDLHYRSFRTALPTVTVQDTGSKDILDAPLLPLTDVFSDGASTIHVDTCQAGSKRCILAREHHDLCLGSYYFCNCALLHCSTGRSFSICWALKEIHCVLWCLLQQIGVAWLSKIYNILLALQAVRTTRSLARTTSLKRAARCATAHCGGELQPRAGAAHCIWTPGSGICISLHCPA